MNFNDQMGPRGEVNEETRHIAAAAGCGLLPGKHATYLSAFPNLGTDQCFTATCDVPENGAFWSITTYGATGFIESEDSIVNSSNVTLNADGTFTAFFRSEVLCGDVPNRLDRSEGWNFMMRIYLPGPSVLDGTFALRPVKPVDRHQTPARRQGAVRRTALSPTKSCPLYFTFSMFFYTSCPHKATHRRL